jgi:hypothetical protein
MWADRNTDRMKRDDKGSSRYNANGVLLSKISEVTVHPGEETGAVRHFIHALFVVLFIMLAVFVCTFVLEKRRGDTGEPPLDGMYQNTMEFGHTVGNSISDMSTKVNRFVKKEEVVSGTHVTV